AQLRPASAARVAGRLPRCGPHLLRARHRAAAAGADAVAVIRAAWTGGSLAPFVAAVDAGRATR
ncbi:MAG TPA: hypothetical protein VK601_19590, partial [Kofleriaceae bacterium]|nr:hypothetical protein [Kofleriaceae bacterium]